MGNSDKHAKNKKVSGKHIKHKPPSKRLLLVEKETTYLVKSRSPFISALKRIQKLLEKFDRSLLPNSKYQNGEFKKVKYVTVKGMGKAIEKTISLGLVFQDELAYKVDTLTGSLDVVDEFQTRLDEFDSDDDYNTESVYQKRSVSYVEVRIWLKRN